MLPGYGNDGLKTGPFATFGLANPTNKGHQIEAIETQCPSRPSNLYFATGKFP
jgi:hypothetical protein